MLFPSPGRVRSSAPRGGVSAAALRAVRRQLVLGSPAGGASQPPGGVGHTLGGGDSDGDEEGDAHLAVFDFGQAAPVGEVTHSRLPPQTQPAHVAPYTAAASMAKASLRGCALPAAKQKPPRIFADSHQLPPLQRQQQPQETPVSVLSAANRSSLWSAQTGGSARTSASAASAGDLRRPASGSHHRSGDAVRHYHTAPSPLAPSAHGNGAGVPPATRTCGLWLGLTSWGAASPAAPARSAGPHDRRRDGAAAATDRGSRLCSIL